MGEAPEWYEVMQLAKYLGVAPWELAEQPLIWRHWAKQAVKAEFEAKKQKKDRKKGGLGGS